jgi:hypothetical protein
LFQQVSQVSKPGLLGQYGAKWNIGARFQRYGVLWQAE